MESGDIALIWADLVGVRGLFAKLMFFNVKSKPGVIYPVTEGKGATMICVGNCACHWEALFRRWSK